MEHIRSARGIGAGIRRARVIGNGEGGELHCVRRNADKELAEGAAVAAFDEGPVADDERVAGTLVEVNEAVLAWRAIE